MKILVLGASGLVGSNVISQALRSPEIALVIAPTRRPLSPDEKLVNPVLADLGDGMRDPANFAVDAVVCALGTTSKKAGSNEAFRHVDYELPLAFAREAFRLGVNTFALVTAIGASVNSSFLYPRLKGELERDIKTVGFTSLTIARPSMIGGDRAEHRGGESVALFLAKFLRPVLPRKFHVNPAENIAAALLEAAVDQHPGCHYRYAESMV